MIGWAIRGHEANETLPDSYFLLLPLLLLPVGAGLQNCLTSPSQGGLLSAPNPSLLLHRILCVFFCLFRSTFATLLKKAKRPKVPQCPGILPFTTHPSPYPSPLSKGQGRGTLISPCLLYCPTLTPPHLPLFSLVPLGTSVTAPASAAHVLLFGRAN